MKNERGMNCPVELTLGLIGGKWKGIILYHLINGKKRFGELKKFMPNITQRMLTKQLRELENDRLIHREVYRVVPPKVEYSLTEQGESLKNTILSLEKWGKNYQQQKL
ncbi:winged helix-turn-helix transcriptional regulator [bacterium endosymbiont of Bathymodiolus sp. 5 South]|jgi:DNA-binding HxlR family transcriptional regulator|uniref:winged helix-turn-helix transcriptional regulator n=1 Tax=bacterium endosymbiont of Bathymodiolus sp. 5 South TaxID=1181670 RepID=UPI0010B8E0CC|nr:helix-turn-helix domain-containing protein [bacterium endosymbiont of Bathymodiolus sp. 5 South]CAC9634670.1 Transcriptional regulator, HxlR family [uncultured Gammaproteobacteria bacterium]SHN90148.1 Transcriptional regulator, HxlR family [bacterium endosymbiont of Bathymodiolus sp. 5 South]SSC08852.1 Transcriptional regulator, HxlR family [bacterium endosymbiont of Bathymodiolus sp. 5 South]VVH58222.1 Transcriptional regulator, HxlR family [uncultured Gammaproteobacteria bacterium]VVH6268